MRKIAVYILFNLIFNLTFSQVKQKNDSLEIWTMFSIGNFITENAHSIASEKWPFKTKSMTGDVLWKELTDSIEKHNKKVWKYLDSHGFNNSEKKYQSDFYSERKRIQKAVDLSSKNIVINNLYEKLRKEKRENYTKLRKLDDSDYEFTIFSFDINKINLQERFEMKFIADLNKMEIKIIR